MPALDLAGLTRYHGKLKDFMATEYAPLNSPSFTGTPAVPTADFGTDTAQIASTAFVQDAVDAVYAAIPQPAADADIDAIFA